MYIEVEERARAESIENINQNLQVNDPKVRKKYKIVLLWFMGWIRFRELFFREAKGKFLKYMVCLFLSN